MFEVCSGRLMRGLFLNLTFDSFGSHFWSGTIHYLWTHGSNLNILYFLEVSKATLPKEVGEVYPLGFWIILLHLGLSLWLLMSESMCGCGCSIISSLMKRLGRTACCSDLLSCSHTSEHLQRLALGCPPQRKVILTGFVGDTFRLKEAYSGGFGDCSSWWYANNPVYDIFIWTYLLARNGATQKLSAYPNAWWSSHIAPFTTLEEVLLWSVPLTIPHPLCYTAYQVYQERRVILIWFVTLLLFALSDRPLDLPFAG